MQILTTVSLFCPFCGNTATSNEQKETWRSLKRRRGLTRQKKMFSLCMTSHIDKVRMGEAKREAEDRLTFDRWRLVNPWVQHYLHAHADSLRSCHLLLLSLFSFFLCPLPCWRIKRQSVADTSPLCVFPFFSLLFDSEASMCSRVPALVTSCQNAVQQLQHLPRPIGEPVGKNESRVPSGEGGGLTGSPEDRCFCS